MGIFINEAIIR